MAGIGNSSEKDTLLCDLVTYFLVADRRRLPIKHQDIMKHVFRGASAGGRVDGSKSTQALMEQARALLDERFGLKLVEIPSKQKSYILVSKFDETIVPPEKQVGDDGDHALKGLIVFVLAATFMRGGSLAEDELWGALKQLGLDPDDRQHPTFGDIRKTVTGDLVRQGYLESKRDGEADPPRTLFSWGPRAVAETSRRDMLDFVCSFYSLSVGAGAQPTDWPAQYAEVMEEGGDRMEEDGSSNGTDDAE